VLGVHEIDFLLKKLADRSTCVTFVVTS